MKSTGFSLLELIISLFLISLILGLLYGVLSMTSNITKESISLGKREDHLRIFYNIFEKDLIAARKKGFKGSSSELSFYTSHLAKYNKRKVNYIFRKDGSLVYITSQDLFDNKKSEVLLKNLKDFKLMYLYSNEDEKWKSEWDSEKEKRLPYMVKVFVEDDKKGIMIPIFTMWKAPSFKEEHE